jgi:hypothetical protein
VRLHRAQEGHVQLLSRVLRPRCVADRVSSETVVMRVGGKELSSAKLNLSLAAIVWVVFSMGIERTDSSAGTAAFIVAMASWFLSWMVR